MIQPYQKWSRWSGNSQEMVRKCLVIFRKCQEMSENGLKWSGNGPGWPWNIQQVSETGPRWSGNGPSQSGNVLKMSRNSLIWKYGPLWSLNVKKWSEMIRILSKTTTKKRGKYILYTSSLSVEGAKAGSKKRKRSTILEEASPFLWLNLYSVFFSFSSNLSIWPGRQVVSYGSRCYTHIFDGLVNCRHSPQHQKHTISPSSSSSSCWP